MYLWNIMNRTDFENALRRGAAAAEAIRAAAHRVHEAVNQRYDKTLPYGFHLDGVARGVETYGHAVCPDAGGVLPLLFGAYYHDSMEDARMTYNDVLAAAREFLPEDGAVTAAEIVYALTNEKGRTRAERANDKYYEGIRMTPYAPLVKMCDRLANVEYSLGRSGEGNSRMAEIYGREMPHFLEQLRSPLAETDIRFSIPGELTRALAGKLRG